MTKSLSTGPVSRTAVALAAGGMLVLVVLGTLGAYALGTWQASVPGPVALGAIGLVYLLAATALIRCGAWHARSLRHIHFTDTLTGLRNRPALHADFDRLSTSGEGEGEDGGERGAEVALAMIDLDGFMHVNENYGHAVGDRAICEAASIISEICGSEARLYRLGGDEFALVKRGELAATLLEGICRKIIERLTKPVMVEARRLSLGASVGLSRTDQSQALPASELLRRADMAMFASKRGGKARCTWFSTKFDTSRDQLRELDEEVRSALASEQFRLNYQPLVDCQTRRVVAIEALLRWERSDGRQIGPSEFIPVAEASGLINPIGLWVLRRACIDALDWDGIKLSVNISPAQLRNPEFPIQLGHILEETGFEPERLELEITETCLVSDPVVAERSLAVIRGFGVNVVLDDFGTGYASIGFLRRFRFEKLKIDRSLVVQADKDDGSRAMMLSSITVARAMKMDVAAEGVETKAQADMVRAAGCDQIQGWLYFKAMPAAEIPQYLGRPIEMAALADGEPEEGMIAA